MDKKTKIRMKQCIKDLKESYKDKDLDFFVGNLKLWLKILEKEVK